MTAFQLPDSVLVDAVGCLTYSFLCLIANSVLLWLLWTHNETNSYTGFISYFTLIGTCSSIIQQFYDYTFWKDIMVQQYHYGKANSQNAEVQYQKGIFGLKLVLSYIRIFAFTVESTLVFFFVLSVASSLYGWWSKKTHIVRVISIAGRILPILLALIMIGLLQTRVVQLHFVSYLMVANLQVLLSLAGACVLLLMILYKYMGNRWQLRTWGSISYSTEGVSASRSSVFRRSGITSRAKANRKRHPNGSFDSWLVVRLLLTFLLLCVFEYYSFMPRLSARGHVVESALRSEPDLSRKRALSSVRGYLTGVSPSMLAFVVFGTTKPFQQKMYTTFVPRIFRKKDSSGIFGQLPFFRTTNDDTRNLTQSSSSVNTARSISQATKSYSALSLSPIRKPEAVARPSPIPEEPRDSREDDLSYLHQSQIGIALSEIPTSHYQSALLHNDTDLPYPGRIVHHSHSSSLPTLQNHPMPVINNFSKPRNHSVDHNYLP
ncbi:hypothetical protein DM02DRAFT_653710 [Periconia macrospinosa]|uniref:Glycoside hydrolase n=1 Tax=Periconia macrospinosa TaxID=97972 RepID=A0A2V1DV77_9PLEO|nr:hypothetical protein DM02DRAFT_653710 [Periconia macrospinosa]